MPMFTYQTPEDTLREMEESRKRIESRNAPAPVPEQGLNANSEVFRYGAKPDYFGSDAGTGSARTQAWQEVKRAWSEAREGERQKYRAQLVQAFSGDPLAAIPGDIKNRQEAEYRTALMDDPDTERKKIALAYYFAQDNPENIGFVYDNIDQFCERFAGGKTSPGKVYDEIADIVAFNKALPEDYRAYREWRDNHGMWRGLWGMVQMGGFGIYQYMQNTGVAISNLLNYQKLEDGRTVMSHLEEEQRSILQPELHKNTVEWQAERNRTMREHYGLGQADIGLSAGLVPQKPNKLGIFDLPALPDFDTSSFGGAAQAGNEQAAANWMKIIKANPDKYPWAQDCSNPVQVEKAYWNEVAKRHKELSGVDTSAVLERKLYQVDSKYGDKEERLAKGLAVEERALQKVRDANDYVKGLITEAQEKYHPDKHEGETVASMFRDGKYMTGVLESLSIIYDQVTESIVPMALSYATTGGAGSNLIFAASMYGEGFNTALENNLDVEEAMDYAGFYTAYEVLPEIALGWFPILKHLTPAGRKAVRQGLPNAVKDYAKAFAKGGFSDTAGELITFAFEKAEDAIRGIGLPNDKKNWDDLTEDEKQDFLTSGLVETIIGSFFTAGLGEAMARRGERGDIKQFNLAAERWIQVIESRVAELQEKPALEEAEAAELRELETVLDNGNYSDFLRMVNRETIREMLFEAKKSAQQPRTETPETNEKVGLQDGVQEGAAPQTGVEKGGLQEQSQDVGTDGTQVSEAAEDGEAEASARAERELKMRRDLPHNPADTAAEVEKWKKLFPNANIQTTDAWTPEQIRILRQRGVLAPEKAQGMFDIKTNTVILNVSNLRPSEVGFKVLHEVGLHYGIRQAFGDETANTLFLAVFDAMQDSPFMQRIIDAYKLRTPMLDENGEAIYNPDGTPLFDDMTDAQKAEAAEEFLAFAAETYGVPIDEIYADNRAEIDKWGREHGRDTHDWNEKRRMTREWMAETGFKPERPGWWKQLISQIRVWLAEHGFGHLREADIETIIQDSFKGASRANRTNRTNGEARYSIPTVVNGVDLKTISGNMSRYFTDIKDAIKALYRKSLLNKEGNKSFVNYAEVTDKERKLLSELCGADLSGAQVHGLDEMGLRHIDKNHGENEDVRGQIPVTEEDVLLIPQIVREATPKYLRKNKAGNYVFQYHIKYDDEYFYLEEYRNGRGKLVSASFWKKKGTTATPASTNKSDDRLTSETLRTRAHNGNIAQDSENASENGEKSRFSVSPVYTGSAADYDQPSLFYVGTGEGAQVFGWGLYGSESRSVAKWYANSDYQRKAFPADEDGNISSDFSLKFVKRNGKPIQTEEYSDDPDNHMYGVLAYSITLSLYDFRRDKSPANHSASELKNKTLEYTEWQLNNFKKSENDPSARYYIKNDIAAAEKAIELIQNGELEFSDFDTSNLKRNLYKQTFWPDKEEDLLDWDKAVPERQKKLIRAQAEKEGIDVSNLVWKGGRILGQNLYNYLETDSYLGSPKAASEFLYRAGIDGVTYIGDSSGVRNYVAFSDKDIRVDEHIRFSVGGVDENLIVVHNVSEQKLRDAIKLGALPVPSIGIIDAEKSDFTDYGRITLVGDRDLIDPRNRKNKVFGADAYSPRRPNVQRLYTDEEFERALKVISPYEPNEADSFDSIQKLVERHQFNSVDSDFEADLKDNDAVRAWYASTREGDEKFEDWWIRVATPALDLHPTERIFDGYTNSGRRRYLPANLETIVKLMTRKTQDGEGFFYGFGNIRALVTKKFKSVEEIQKNRDKIVSGEDYKAIKKEVQDEYYELLNDIESAMVYGDVPRSRDAAESILIAFAEGTRKRGNWEWLVKTLGRDNEIYQEMADFLMKLKNLPTPMFEAKPQRAVYLDEFKAAVVPAETSNDILTALEQSGVKVYTYTDDAERKATLQKATQDQNLRFSLGDIDGNEAARQYIDIIKPYVPFDVHDKDGAYYAQILKEKAGVDLEPEDAMQIAQEAWHERRKQSVKKSWNQAYAYFAQSNPLFDFLLGFAGSNFQIRPAHRFEGEKFTGSFIAPEFVKYSEKREQGERETDWSYNRYKEKRERALKSAKGMHSDEAAAAYVRQFGGDELEIEQQIIDLLRDLKRTDIRSSYAQFKRDNFARDRMEQAEYEAMMEDIFQRELDDKVISILSAGVPVVTPDWVAENRDVYKELYKRLLSKDGKEAPYTPSQKDIEAMNLAIVQEGADAATYAKAYKEARAASAREWMEKVSELRKKVIEGKENAMKLQREASALLKRAGLEGDRSFSARIINLMGFQTEARRQKAFDQLMSDILAAGTAAKQMKVYDRLQERLQQLGRRADVGRKAIGVRDEATQIQIDKIRDIAAMSTYEIAARQSELQDAINAAQEHGESSVEFEEEMALLSKYGDLANKTAAELTLALADLNELAVTGKRKIRERLMERQGQDRMRIQESVDLINGGNFAAMGDLDELENRRNQEAGTMKATAAFDLFSGFNLWGKLTALNLAGNKNIRDTVFYRMMEQTHECARNQDTMNEKHQNDTLAAIDRIFGTKGAFERAAKLQELRKVQDKTGVMLRYIIDREKKIEYRKMSLDEARQLLADYDNKTAAGERPALKDYEAEAIRHQLLVYDRKLDKKATEYLDSVTEKLIQMAEEEKERGEKTVVIPVPKYTAESELKLSQMQALYQYLMWQQKNTRYKMVFNGWTEESIKQLEGFLAPETMAFGAWMAEQLDADRADIDPVYERLYMTAFPHVESYFPAVYHHRGQNTRLGNAQGVDLGAAGAGGQAMAFSPGALRQRVFHMSELRNVDALNVFQNHRMIMTHFVTHGEAARELRAVFANKDVKQAIIEQLGAKQYSSLTEDIADFINGGHVQIDHAAMLRGLYSAAVRSKMMINITSGIKQTLGGLTYLQDIPLKDFVAGVNYAVAHPKEVWQTLGKTEYFQNRWRSGSNRDLRMLLDRAGKNGQMDVLMEKADTLSSIPLRLGDAGAVLFGGYAVYRYTYQQGIKRGLSEAEAKRRALLEWEMSTERTQQSSQVHMQNKIQKGNTLERILSTYLSNQILMWNHYAPRFFKGDFKGGARGMLTAAITSVAMTTMNQLFRKGIWVDDWEFWDYFWEYLADVLNGSGAAGVYLERGIEGARAYGRGKDVLQGDEERAARAVQNILKAPFSDKDYETGFQDAIDILTFTGYFYAPITPALSAVREGRKTKNFWQRLFNRDKDE